MSGRITTVLFDVDDTLVVEMATEMAVMLDACELAEERRDVDSEELYDALLERSEALWRDSPEHAYCESIGFASFEGLWSTFEGDVPQMKRLREWAPAYRHEAWARALSDVSVEDGALADELAEAYRVERRKRHVVFDETIDVLKDLRGDYRLGIVTNGAVDIQQSKIKGAGLAKYFEAVVIASEVGVGKPDPKPFRAILREMDVGAGETAMVGNDLDSDIQGAKNADLFAVWLSRGRSRADHGVAPDVRITKLCDLREAIECLQ